MSSWKSLEGTKRELEKIEGKEDLFNLYCLSMLCDEAFLSSAFEPDIAWDQEIQLTSSGIKLLDTLHRAGIAFGGHIEKLILFRLFYHYDLLIDHKKTNAKGIIDLLNSMHIRSQARWPYIYGKILYDKFNKIGFVDRTNRLEPEKAEELLKGTPHGVFQMGKYVSGPFGILESREKRTIYPSLKLLLWHCSDPGCRGKHYVELQQFKSPFQKGSDTIVRFVIDTLGYPSEWSSSLERLHRENLWPNGRPYCDISHVIGDCIIGIEKSQLLLRCLMSSHNPSFIEILRRAKKAIKTPAEIADSLSVDELHQLLLLMTDRELIEFIDELVFKQIIRIPPTELRKRKSPLLAGSRDQVSTISSLGIRSIGHPPIVELVTAIRLAYEKMNLMDELKWRLRGHLLGTMNHSIVDFIRSHGPRQTAKELVFSSPAISKKIADEYMFSIFDDVDEDRYISRFLWKMGFTLPRYDMELENLRGHLREFKKALLLTEPGLTSPEKERIRAAGVNLFVSIEVFLEDLVCYNTWLLSSDHYHTGTGFKYVKTDAHSSVIRVMGEEIVSGHERFKWSVRGENSLGALLAYLQGFCSWMETLDGREKEGLRRKPEDYPHYAEDTVWIFPFRHTALWADSDSAVLHSYHDVLKTICTQLSQADPAGVRNGLDHKRPDSEFPSRAKMLNCVDKILSVVEIADDNCLYPKLYWGVKSDRSEYGEIVDTLRDYRGNCVSMNFPSFSLVLKEMSFGIPYLLLKYDFLNLPNTNMYLLPIAESVYQSYWKEYPRGRVITGRESSAKEDDHPEESRERRTEI